MGNGRARRWGSLALVYLGVRRDARTADVRASWPVVVTAGVVGALVIAGLSHLF